MASRSPVDRRFPLLVLAAATLALCCSGSIPQDPAPRILVDGEPWWRASWQSSGVMSMIGTPDRPAPGDPIDIGGVWLALPEGDDLRFVDEWERAGRILRQRGDRHETVALDGDGLVDADAASLATLRGVHLTAWNQRVADAVARLGPSVVITITHECATGPERALRTLRIAGSHISFSTVDLTPFGAAAGLRVLEVEQPEVAGAETVRRFAELRSLRWHSFPDADLQSLAGLTELRHVSLRRGHYASLAPLARLPRLEVLRSLYAPVTALPIDGFPRLRELELPGAEVSVPELRASGTRTPAAW